MKLANLRRQVDNETEELRNPEHKLIQICKTKFRASSELILQERTQKLWAHDFIHGKERRLLRSHY